MRASSFGHNRSRLARPLLSRPVPAAKDAGRTGDGLPATTRPAVDRWPGVTAGAESGRRPPAWPPFASRGTRTAGPVPANRPAAAATEWMPTPAAPGGCPRAGGASGPGSVEGPAGANGAPTSSSGRLRSPTGPPPRPVRVFAGTGAPHGVAAREASSAKKSRAGGGNAFATFAAKCLPIRPFPGRRSAPTAPGDATDRAKSDGSGS